MSKIEKIIIISISTILVIILIGLGIANQIMPKEQQLKYKDLSFTYEYERKGTKYVGEYYEEFIATITNNSNEPLESINDLDLTLIFEGDVICYLHKNEYILQEQLLPGKTKQYKLEYDFVSFVFPEDKANNAFFEYKHTATKVTDVSYKFNGKDPQATANTADKIATLLKTNLLIIVISIIVFLIIKAKNILKINSKTEEGIAKSDNNDYEEKTEALDVTQDFRKKNAALVRCKNGQYVRSKSERDIFDFFTDNQIRCIYEFKYINNYYKKVFYTDFYLPKYNLYLEYFGMNDPEYIKNRDEKILIYRSDKTINFEYITFEDDNLIYEKLNDICQKYDIPIKI